MTEDTYADNLNRGDLEKRKFEANTDGDTAVRTTGGVTDSAGRELTTLMDEHFRRQETLLLNMSNDLKELLTHIRFVTGLGYDPDNEQGG